MKTEAQGSKTGIVMRGNIPIPEIPQGEEVWLILLVTSVRDRRTGQGKPFCEAQARNATGTVNLKIWGETMLIWKEMRPGLWGVTGKVESFQDRTHLVVSEYRPITLQQYQEHQSADPVAPHAYTIDIETLALPDFRERVGSQLERTMRLGNMRYEQQQRYLEDIAAEEERCYQLGSLSATSGRVLTVAVHVGPIAGLRFEGLEQPESEHVFGIDAGGEEQQEKQTLTQFLELLKDFDCEYDELVGHNIISFDLPFIFQRCLVNGLTVHPFVNLAEFHVRGVFDTMHRWWFGAKRHVSLDDIAWALDIQSSKTAEVEGSKVFDLYQAGRLAEIREYNLNDVRVTRKIYERIVASFGR
ncbi:MAG TPA: ribonuclease H-like domain-containing protein [Pyrinomonadaceae bacterium]|nr:ribonuclease H-like domain-containing protein [Pyrinomonadaceae bacterium]